MLSNAGIIFYVLTNTYHFVKGSSPVGLEFIDWDGLETCRPVSYSLPSSENSIITEVQYASNAGEQLKVVGAGHSFSGIQLTDGVQDAPAGRLMSLDLLSGIISVQVVR